MQSLSAFNVRFEVHTEAFAEDADILGCDTVLFGMLFPLFPNTVVPSSTRGKQPKKNGLETSSHLKLDGTSRDRSRFCGP